MARPGIGYNDVATAAQELSNQGKNPTIEQIRLVLGTGSSTTIAHHLRRWKEARTDDDSTSASKHIPLELTSAIKGVWEQLAQHADEKVFRLDEKHQQTLEATQQELQKYKTNNQRWQQMYNQWIKEKDELVQEKQSFQHLISALQHANAGLTAKLNAQDIQIIEKQQRIDELNRLHKQAQENLEHYRESMRVQRITEQERQAQQLLQAEMMLKSTMQQLELATHENMTLHQSRDEIRHRFDTLQSAFTEIEKKQIRSGMEAVHWQQQYETLLKKSDDNYSQLIGQQKQNAMLFQQLSVLHEEIRTLESRNKTLQNENIAMIQEKAELDGINRQLQKMVHDKKIA